MIRAHDRRALEEMARAAAARHGLEAALVCAVVEQESGWEPCAFRPESESGFAGRYGEAYGKIVGASAQQYDDKWIKFEDVFYASYGLMQVMYCVAVETFPKEGALLRFPHMLCDPEVGLEFGCRLLDRKIDRAGSVKKGLLNWNGGGNAAYPGEVLARMAKYL
jgi:soluble lytic murein transglycosylase-like protein